MIAGSAPIMLPTEALEECVALWVMSEARKYITLTGIHHFNIAVVY